MGKQHSFFGSAFYYTLGVILAQGATFLIMMLLADMMGTNYADYKYVTLYTLWVPVFTSLIGLEAASSLNNARLKFGVQNLDRYASSLLGIGLLMVAVIALLFTIFQSFFTTALEFPLPVLYMMLTQAFFAFVLSVIAQKSRVTNQPVKFIVWTAFVSILRLGLSLLFVSHMQQDKYMGDIFASVTSYVIFGAVALVLLVRNGHSLGNKEFWRFCLTLSIPMVFHTLSNIILGRSDQYMLSRMSTDEQTAVYGFVYNVSMAANAVWLAFNNAWTVWYYDRTKENKTAEIHDLFKKYAGFVTLLTVAIMMVAPDIVMFFGKTEYASGVALVPMIMLGCYFMFLYSFPVAYETYKVKTLYIAIGTVAAAGINIGLNFYFIPRWGAAGAALTTLISYIALFIFHYLIARFAVKNFQIPFRYLLIPALLMVGVTALTYVILDISVLRWIAGAASLVCSFLVFRKSRHIMM